MLKNENIICISSIDWDFIWQGHQEIMSTFARNGNRVLFIENTGVRPPGIRDIPRIKKRIRNWFKGVKGIRKERDNLYVFSPLALPFPYSRIARWVNRYLLLRIVKSWIQIMDFAGPIIWTFLPTGTTLDLINNINKELLIYYCLDNLAASSPLAKRVKTYEKKLLRQADLVFVTADTLYRSCSEVSKEVYKFPFTVNIAKFEQALHQNDKVPESMRDIKRPIVGFVGGVRKWIDKDLIRYLATMEPEFSFVFIGPLQTDVKELTKINNLYFLGQKDHNDIPAYINSFSVAIVPYILTDFTKSIFPAKLNEYLAMGKPVISTNLPEIEEFNKKYGNIIYVANKPEDFDRYINKAIKEDSDALRERRIGIARENSWPNRIEEMCNLIEKAINKKIIDRELTWKENLISFYRITRRRLVRLGAICLLVYLLLFGIPFVWFLATPLKIAELPQKADAIVVFAGGVGESGKAGQGYEERVQYAVELYRQGYAGYLIFSSGYIYAFKEPIVMKALAVSLGVPEGAILLEEKATNTYENVKFSKEILDKKGWDSILLVSSPYHMRRASLIFRKIGKEIEVIRTPIPQSLFYSRKEGIKLRHIQGIMHEYLGIIYYWWKGWI